MPLRAILEVRCVAGVLDMRMRCEEDQTPMSGNSRHPFARLPEVLVLPVVRSDHIASLALGISGLGLRQCLGDSASLA